MTFRALHDRVVVRRIEEEEKTAGSCNRKAESTWMSAWRSGALKVGNDAA
jgi:co-chaperonin GroES (HSP10)